MHDSKPGVVTSTAELINPSRERKIGKNKREREKKKEG